MDHQCRTGRQTSPMVGRSSFFGTEESLLQFCEDAAHNAGRPRIAGETFDHGAQNHHPGMRCNDLR